jgi:hypothetical protein
VGRADFLYARWNTLDCIRWEGVSGSSSAPAPPVPAPWDLVPLAPVASPGATRGSLPFGFLRPAAAVGGESRVIATGRGGRCHGNGEKRSGMVTIICGSVPRLWPESGRGMWCGAGHRVTSLGFVGGHVAKSALFISDRTRELQFDLQSSRPRDIQPAEAHAGATAASDDQNDGSR